MIKDNLGTLADKMTFDAAGDADKTVYSTQVIDRSDGVVAGENPGDLGNFADLALHSNHEGVTQATSATDANPGNNKVFVVSLISGDDLDAGGNNVDTTKLKGEQEVARLPASTAAGALEANPVPFKIGKINANEIFGRYLQLKVVVPGKCKADINSFFASQGGDVHRSYPRRYTIE